MGEGRKAAIVRKLSAAVRRVPSSWHSNQSHHLPPEVNICLAAQPVSLAHLEASTVFGKFDLLVVSLYLKSSPQCH